MAKIAVITGANAMDSKSLARFLQYKDYKIVLTYRRNTLFHEEDWFKEVQIEEQNRLKIEFEPCDIIDQNSVRECIKSVLEKHGQLDELYLLAAMSHVGNSFKQKEYSILCNGQSYYYFLEALKEFSPKTKTYGAMTSELAGNVPSGTFFNEETPWMPKSPYSLGKQLGGSWIKFYRESLDSQLFACFGILFNHSNFYRTPDFFVAKVAKAAAAIALGKQKELPLGNLNFYRDEHWSDFGVEMMWKMLQNEKPEDYVVGVGQTFHGEEFLDEAFNRVNLKWQDYVIQDKNLLRPNEVHRLVSDPSKAKKELGWNPYRMSFKDHMGYLVDFWLAKEQGKEYKIPNMWEKYP
jgi:GDPmannose 4,6-dehydratase